MKDKTEWVEVASVGNDEEAALIAGLLSSRDIPCEVEGPSATPWPADHAEEARQVLAAQKRAFQETPADEADTETGVE